MQKHLFAFAILFACAIPATAQIYDTEVWVGSLDMSGATLEVSKLVNISSHPGYDNQPAFVMDSDHLVFTSESEDLDDTGHGVHPVYYDLTTGKANAPAGMSGFSPTPSADGKTLMLLRDGRVFLHDASGKELSALTDTKDAGYFARFDDRTWVLFMNDKQRRIVIYDTKTKALDTMAVGANTPPYKVPNQRAVTFVAQEPFPEPEGEAAKNAPPAQLFLRRLDLKTKKVETLSRIPFPTGGHHVWTSRGTILMASGKTIYEWAPAHPEEWKPVFVSDHPDLQGMTRLAISPKGDRIAIVSTPSDDTVIRDSRAASNRALAGHNGDAFARLFEKDATVVTSKGLLLQGRETNQKSIEELWKARPDIVFVRNTAHVEISHSDPDAAEHGIWTGRATNATGPAEWHGTYLAKWRKKMTDSGYPSWTIASELFVALDCSGAGCDSR